MSLSETQLFLSLKSTLLYNYTHNCFLWAVFLIKEIAQLPAGSFLTKIWIGLDFGRFSQNYRVALYNSDKKCYPPAPLEKISKKFFSSFLNQVHFIFVSLQPLSKTFPNYLCTY
jgi:hypothetical protein